MSRHPASDATEPSPESQARPEPTEPGASRLPARPVLRWHESWIIRAAAMAAFILFLGYAVSAFFAYESIDSIARLAHDREIESTLAGHLETLKSAHDLQRQLVVTRLEQQIRDLRAAGVERPASAADARTMLEKAGIDILAPGAEVKVEPDTETPPEAPAGVVWADRTHLRMPGFVVEVPHGDLYVRFKQAEDVRQRYQLFGAQLDGEIRPTLLRASALVLVVSFLLLASIFIYYAHRFRRRTFEVIDGFSEWSERDSGFRFDPLYPGELRLITQQFNAMADEVEANRQKSLYLEKIASWQIIARKLAHEIKNPLTPIQMMVSQLKRRYKGDDGEFARLLDEAQTIITEEVAGLRRMVDNFSEFARLPQPVFKPADLSAVCRHVVELERQRFPHHEIGFVTGLREAPASVDADLLRQVLINLIKNAGEAAGERPARITVELTPAGADWLVAVRDDGPGIPEEHLSRIFEAYFTTKHTGPSPGMGLGLAVCQKIVMDHGGTMSVRSRPGETVFTIRLPKRRRE